MINCERVSTLEHSPIVGIRGVITGEYLKRLGFIPERHFTVIGCPSLYIFGDKLYRRNIKYDIYSSISLSLRPSLTMMNDNLMNLVKNNDDWHVVVQNLDELKCIQLGISDEQQKKQYFYTDINNDIYTHNHIKGFVCAGDWIRYMRKKDFSFGGLFHGSVAGFLGGANTVVFPSDSRMREMCEYHNLPAIPASDYKNVYTVDEILEKVDLDSHIKVHRNNFEKYCEFLNQIGMPSVWNLNEEPKDELLLLSRLVDNCLNKDKNELVQTWSDYYIRSQRNWKKRALMNAVTNQRTTEKTVHVTEKIPIFTWHRIVNDSVKEKNYANDEFVESKSIFEKQLAYLADNGYKAITLDDFYDWFKGKIEFDNKTIVLTFDDGDAEMYYLVWPLLQKYGFCATSFIVGARTMTEDRMWIESERSFITTNMIKKVQEIDSCIDFQSHTWNLHEKIEGKSKVYTCDVESLNEDFENMDKFFSFKYIAYPYGAYTDDLIDQAKSHGYRLGFTFGNVKNNDFATRLHNKYTLPRIKIGAGCGTAVLEKWLNLY